MMIFEGEEEKRTRYDEGKEEERGATSGSSLSQASGALDADS